jgi:alkanesulfonate monooxygenase SsuD/methylene tetrahydromethanopterin reductase-like flavin-dependent oxidoreductase (luciferase family)
MSQLPTLEQLQNIDPTIPGGAPIVGTPDDCIRAIERYQAETRVTHLAMGMHLPGLAPEKIMGNLELFAQKVMPRFK